MWLRQMKNNELPNNPRKRQAPFPQSQIVQDDGSFPKGAELLCIICMAQVADQSVLPTIR